MGNHTIVPAVNPSCNELIYTYIRCILLMRNFKIHPGCYHHKIVITKGNGTVTHTYHKLTNTNDTNDEYDQLFNNINNSTELSEVPQYDENNYTNENGETFNFNVTNGGFPENYNIISTNVLQINKCSIKTNVTA